MDLTHDSRYVHGEGGGRGEDIEEERGGKGLVVEGHQVREHHSCVG